MLHQIAEAFYIAFLLTATGYKPKTHDLAVIHQKAASIEPRFNNVFRMHGEKNKELFSLLRKAYTEARYKNTYSIRREQLLDIENKISGLQRLTLEVCEERLIKILSPVYYKRKDYSERKNLLE